MLFDCAGLLTETEDILDELTQEAAIESLQKAILVLYCIDISRPAIEWAEDLALCEKLRVDLEPDDCFVFHLKPVFCSS